MGTAHSRSPRETVTLPVWARIATRQRGARWRKARSPDRSRTCHLAAALNLDCEAVRATACHFPSWHGGVMTSIRNYQPVE